MTELVTETVDGEICQYYPLGDHVVRAIGVCGGRPTFKYTHIEITGTLERLAAGESLDRAAEKPKFGNCKGMLTIVVEDKEHLEDFKAYMP